MVTLNKKKVGGGRTIPYRSQVKHDAQENKVKSQNGVLNDL